MVLPHERTHSGPKEGRLRLLRATRTELEPIFLLYEGDPLEPPAREPDLQSGGDKLWRVGDAPSFEQTDCLLDRRRAITAYETVARLLAQEGGSPIPDGRARADAAGRANDLSDPPRRGARHMASGGTPNDEPDDELPGVVLYRDGRYELLAGDGARTSTSSSELHRRA